MSDDWKPGDLALCVQSRGGRLTIGAVYTVRALNTAWLDECGLGLILHERPCHSPIDGGWVASAFRKINPLTDEERQEALRDLKLSEKVS